MQDEGKDIKIAVTEKDKEQMWTKVKEGNGKKKLENIQDREPLHVSFSSSTRESSG